MRFATAVADRRATPTVDVAAVVTVRTAEPPATAALIASTCTASGAMFAVCATADVTAVVVERPAETAAPTGRATASARFADCTRATGTFGAAGACGALCATTAGAAGIAASAGLAGTAASGALGVGAGD
jgi:hypothetical protein